MAGEPTFDADIDAVLGGGVDEEGYWAAVTRLHRHDDLGLVERLLELLADDRAAARKFAADALGQTGTRHEGEPERQVRIDPPYAARVVDALIAAAGHERDADVSGAIATALGHRHDPRAIGCLARLATHPSDDVRWSTAIALGTIGSDAAVAPLLQLTRDPYPAARDWATFGLGTLNRSLDTPEIRDALAERLCDPDGQTREEALAGLAAHGDARAVEPLLAHLSGLDPLSGNSVLDDALIAIAAASADPRLKPHLERLAREHDDPGP